MNFLETLIRSATTPDPAPHSGEAFGIWVYYTSLDSARSYCEFALNHCENAELKELIRALIHDVEEPQLKRCGEWMKEHGVPFPKPFPRYSAVSEPIPMGARLQDLDIANMQVLKVNGLLNLSELNMKQSLRIDLSRLYLSWFHELLPVASQLRQLLPKYGWLLAPPPFHSATPAAK